jgi:hypothetical protein
MGFFLMMILGFIWWWPLGLIILVALMASGRIGYWRRPLIAGNGPVDDWDHVTRMDRMGRKRIVFPPSGSEGIGGVHHQSAIVLSMTIALRHCAGSKTSNASSRNS